MGKPLSSKRTTEKLHEICNSYLVDNFHKFRESDKIKVALAIEQKYIPNILEHSGGIEFDGNINVTDRFKKHFAEINERFSIPL